MLVARFAKRMVVWLLEAASQVLLVGLFLVMQGGPSDSGLLYDLDFEMRAVTVVFFSTGYFFTTLIGRLFWSTRRVWFYSPAAAALFVIHSQLLFLGLRGWGLGQRLVVQTAGALIAIGTTLAGSYMLRRWKDSNPKGRARSQPSPA